MTVSGSDPKEPAAPKPRRRGQPPLPQLPPLRTFTIEYMHPVEGVRRIQATGHFTQIPQPHVIVIFEYCRMHDSQYTIIHQVRRIVHGFIDVWEETTPTTTTVQ